MLLGNYLVTAWRNILRHKLFSTINILGLAIGLAAVMLITLFVRDELSFDGFWNNADNMYRIHVQVDVPGKDPEYHTAAPPPLAEAFRKDFPEIEAVSRILFARPNAIVEGTNVETYIEFVDDHILDILEFDTVYGDMSSALNDYNSLVLNQSQAIKLFGDVNPVGKNLSVQINREIREFKITAVIEDSPDNSMIPIHGLALLNEEYFGGNMMKAWYRNFFFTFFTVKPDVNLDDLVKRFPDFINRNYPKVPFAGPEVKPAKVIQLSIMNVKDLHLKAKGQFDPGVQGNMNTVIIFSVVALLILIIASINFMNLSTARASVRAREVGIRKVMGASRKNLIVQFLGESILLTLFSLIMALLFVELSLPFYNDLINKILVIDYLSMDMFFIILFALLIGLLGGIYPALILSSFHPAKVLKANKSTETNASIKFRTSLVIIQFTISIILFVSTSVIFSQMKYAENMDLGYNKENLLTVFGNDYQKLVDNIDIIVRRLNRLEGVSSVTYSDSSFPGANFSFLDPIRTEKTTEYNPIMLNFRQVGYDFLKTYDIPLLAGRAYQRDRNDERPTNEQLASGEGFTAGLILNRSAVRKLGFGTPEEAIGKLLYMNVGQISAEGSQEMLEAEFAVIGVIEDVHFNDLKSEIPAEFYQLFEKRAFFVMLRYAGNPMDLLEETRKVWQDQLSGVSFEYRFATEALAEQYAQEKGEMTMFAAFSTLAIFIACLGLFGLASFTAERRTKEIGIRKVMGAKTTDIVKLLVWQFSKPVLIANLIAWPISYYAMSRWLESFVYRMDNIIIIALCLVAGLAALLIAWTTVAGNSFAIAKQNPIKALRYE